MFVDELTPESELLRKKFNDLRGATVSAFAHAEFMMKTYLIALSNTEKFEDGGGYSHKLEKLTQNFKTSFAANSFPDFICSDVNLLIDAFEKVIDDRNQFVHGIDRLNTSKGEIVMKRCLPASGDRHQIILKKYDLDTMEENVKTFDEICRAIISLIMDIGSLFDLDFARYSLQENDS